MNSLMFKKIWNLIYRATTLNGWNEERMYGRGMYLRIPTVADHYFSIVFVSCRNHFETIVEKGNEPYDRRQKGMKSFGTAAEIRTVECWYTDRNKVLEIHKDKDALLMDFNSPIEDVYAVMDAVQIDWVKVINFWLESDVLISDEFEKFCSIRDGKEIREKLKQLISY